jgi:hypothetical protein
MVDNEVIDRADTARSRRSTDAATDVNAVPLVIVPDKLYRVGGCIPMDGRASWAPRSATGYQPCEYAIQEVFTGGLRNPFDAFDDAAAATVWRYDRGGPPAFLRCP